MAARLSRGAPRALLLGTVSAWPLCKRRPVLAEEELESSGSGARASRARAALLSTPQTPLPKSSREHHAAASASSSSSSSSFEALFDCGRFHEALSSRQRPGSDQPPGGTKTEMASYMQSVFERIRGELGELSRDERSASSSAESWVERGFDDCSGGNRDGVQCWVKIDLAKQRTNFCYDLPEVPVNALDLMSLISDVQNAETWFPFCRRSCELHVLPGPLPFVRIFGVEVGVQMFSIETVFVMAVENQLAENDCIIIYMFSPPERVMRSESATEWMGAEIPGMPSGLLNFRLPWEYQRICIFPISEKKCRLRCDVKVVDLFPPIPPVSRFFLRECSKRIVGLLENMAGSSVTREGGLMSRYPDLHLFWLEQLNARTANASDAVR